MCQILIVEDESSVLDIIKNFLDSIKFAHRSATNAMEALYVVEKYKTVRVCIIDLHMPGMDGLTLCRKIKAIDPMMVCIATTGYSTLFSLVECRQAGFDDILFKPFDFELLKRVILEYDARLNRWAKS